MRHPFIAKNSTGAKSIKPTNIADTSNNPPKKRSWFRFSLRSLLLLTALVAIVFAIIGGDIGKARRRAQDMRILRENGFELSGYPTPTSYQKTLMRFLPVERVLAPTSATYNREPVAREQLEILARYPQWCSLNFTTPDDCDQTLRAGINNWREVDQLWLRGEAGNDAIPPLDQHQFLRSLHLNLPNCDSDILPAIVQAPELHDLAIQANLSDQSLADVLAMPSLWHLQIFGNQRITSAPFTETSNSSIRFLSVGETQFGDAGLQAVLKWPELEKLYAWDTPIGDQAFVEFETPQSSKLAALRLPGTQVTSAALPGIAKLKNLQVLELSQTHVSDENLEVLASLPSLDQLLLNDCLIMDEGFRKLRSPSLTEIELDHTLVTAAAFENIAERLPALRLCSIIGCWRISAAEGKALQQLYPDIFFLGVENE